MVYTEPPGKPSIYLKWNIIHHEKDVNPAICSSMDESGGHYAKWSKPDRVKQTAQPHSNVKS